ncbi:MAG: hypothetical protein IIU36_00035 [Firmicutes bacterium]|nr:hypothetical protein [Bacillota bacterium]
MKNFKRIIAVICVMMMAFTLLAGCGGNSGNDGPEEMGEIKPINLMDEVMSLFATDVDLDLSGKYETLQDIPDGNIDPDLVGIWKSADGDYTYEYTEDGVCKAEIASYGMTNESPYTCFVVGDRRIVAEEAEVMTDDENTSQKELTFTSYKVENGALYFMPVETVMEGFTSSVTAGFVFYKADENGDISDSLKNNPISPESFYGEWTYDGGTVTIDGNGITFSDAPDEIGTEPLAFSLDENGKIIVEAQGKSTPYNFNIAVRISYSQEEVGKVEGEEMSFHLFYYGEDKDDRPNLDLVMTDWHEEYQYDQFNFDVEFTKPLE